MTLPPPSLAAIRQPAFMLDAAGRIAAANDLAEALAGRTLAGLAAPETARILSCRRWDGTPLLPTELPSRRALAGEEVIEEPLLATAADGRTLTVLATASPIREEDAVVGALVLWQDITERVQVEAALQESERRHAFLLALGDHLRDLTLVGEITAAASEMIGRNLGVDRVISCEVGEAGDCAIVRADWAPGAVPAAASLYRMDDLDPGRRYRQGSVLRIGDLAAGHDGEETALPGFLSVRASLGVPFFRNGRLTAILAVQSALPRAWTDAEVELVRQAGDRVWSAVRRARAEDAMRASEARLRLALESAEIGIWDRDVATDLVTVSPQFLGRYGLEGEVVTSYASWERLIHPDDRERVEAGRRATIETGAPLDLEFRVALPSGERIWVQFKGRGVPDGRGALTRVMGVLIDVTARKEAERALARYADDLRASQDQLRDVIDATGAGYFFISLQEGQSTLSRRGAELLGFETQEMPSLPEIVSEAQARMHPNDLNRVISSFLMFVETESERNEMEFRVRAPDGGWRWVQAISTSAERDEAGHVVALAGFLFDIDEKRKAEEALRRSNKELQQFAYVASHDLQEPLRSVISFSQLLEKRYTGRLDQDADEFIGFIVEGGLRMQALIQDLLQFSRVEMTAKPLEPTDVAAVVAAVVRSMETPLQEAGASVTVGHTPMVKADAAQLEQVFTNLLGNAIKYRREGVLPEIRIEGRRAGPMVEITVADNGIGIEAEYFDRIFEMFRRLHTHDEYEGTGIGLAVVKRIVERHGGTVRVESTPGEGSTFSFTLPAA
jgi:two-component system, chemotaxis family, sensor kinase Cph1